MWRKGNPHALLLGMQTGAASVENSKNFPPKLKMEVAFDLVIPLVGLCPRNSKTSIKIICAPQCSQQHYLQ